MRVSLVEIDVALILGRQYISASEKWWLGSLSGFRQVTGAPNVRQGLHPGKCCMHPTRMEKRCLQGNQARAFRWRRRVFAQCILHSVCNMPFA